MSTASPEDGRLAASLPTPTAEEIREDLKSAPYNDVVFTTLPTDTGKSPYIPLPP